MIRRRPLLFWVVAVAFVALTLWWTFSMPYRPDRLFAPIPDDAAFISQHRGLLARWDSFHQNPLALTLFRSFGLRLSALKDLTEDPETRAWFEKLAARDVVLSYIPACGPYREPAWVFTSWIGGRSQRLRWNLNARKMKGFTRSKPYRGRPYWIVESPFLQSDNTLTLTLVEGMLIGCLSGRNETMRYVLDVVDGLEPSIRVRPDFPADTAWCESADAPDRGWADLSVLAAPAGGLPPRVVRFEFTDLSPAALRGQMCAANPFPVSPAAVPAIGDRQFSGVLGGSPVAVAICRRELLPAVAKNSGNILMRTAEGLMEAFQSDEVAVALLGDEMNGRFKGVRVPTVVGGVTVADPDAVLAQVAGVLDRLNARHRWGLIPHELDAAGLSVFAVDGTGNSLYSSLSLDEKVAYCLTDGWLFLGSNSDGLVRLMEQRREGADVAVGAVSSWAAEMEAAGTPCCAWVDLARGARTLRLAIAAYSLKLLMEDAQKTMVLRQSLNEAKAWIDAMEPLESCRLWVEPGRDELMVRFVAGKEAL